VLGGRNDVRDDHARLRDVPEHATDQSPLRRRPSFEAPPNGAPLCHAYDEEFPMSDVDNKVEQAKGRVKQAAGDLTDNDDLKREGAADKAAGSAKEKVEAAKDKVEDAIDGVKDRLRKD
jgi:uncharacterized protein YjbJ (UPF0337 family)